MATASPTPMAAPIRMSQRQLRRPASRTARTVVTRSEKSKQYDDSSEDEIPMPMKLSALTKALLNDGPEASIPASPPRTRRQAAVLGTAQAFRQSNRSNGSKHVAQNSSPAREPSPARKRVVRLSNTPQSLSQLGSSATNRRTSATRSNSSRLDNAQDNPQESAQDEQQKHEAVNTPAQARIVRIITGSANGNRLGSGPLSARSAAETEAENSEGPDTLARNAAIGNGSSVSHYPPKSRDDNVNLQSSMRVKRVGKLSGGFFSGPARRGRRRQSEEEAGLGEMGSQEPQSQAQHQPEQPYYSEFNSGSPVSGSAVRSHRRNASKVDVRVDSAKASPEADNHAEAEVSRIGDIGHLLSVGRLQSNDKENEIPFYQKWGKSLITDKPTEAPPRIDIAVQGSPERKPLAAIGKNTTPHQAPPPPKMSVLEAATSMAGATAVTTQTKQRRTVLKVNNKVYTRLDCLGRGGSGKVYRVMAENGSMMALKRVSLENADESTLNGYLGEIDLLKRLTGVDRVVNLFDSEMNHEKQMLSLVMEMGERALDKILHTHQSAETAKLDPVFIRYFWKEMLECVQSVHQHDIVHSDLKPANFVLVQGRLKLIDFGIANAIQTDETVNVHRETQIGTPNYMSPESLMDSNSMRGPRIPGRPKLMKLGKPSDVWSLGCILYQMVYGVPPFGHIANHMVRCQAIINWDHNIEFPTRATGGFLVPPSLVRTMRRCLMRDQHMRPTCQELLHYSDPFLYPPELNEKALPIDEELLGRIIQSVVARCRERMPSEAEASTAWPQAYWTNIRKAVMGKM